MVDGVEKKAKPRMSSPFWQLPSQGTFFLGSFTVFAGGALAGAWHILRKEQFRFDLRQHRTPFAVASKALLLGTMLCFGSFAAGTAAFMASTGISTFPEFGRVLTKKFASVEALKTTDAFVLADLEEKRRLSEQEEMALWEKYFTLPTEASKEKDKN